MFIQVAREQNIKTHSLVEILTICQITFFQKYILKYGRRVEKSWCSVES